MTAKPSIAIYNASAGSGKTFALVRDYLYILFKSDNEFKFRNILAITFTNKAVGEMKSRIIESLKSFSRGEPSAMRTSLTEATGVTEDALREKAERLLANIIQDYASFDVVTIDTFTHRIIRTFAHDLHIAQNFEVALHTEEVLQLAVDNLIDRAGHDPQITPVLLDYALEKVGDDKSWDISKDFYEIAKLLLSENDRSYIKMLQERSLHDFTELKKHLLQELAKKEKAINTASQELLDLIAAHGLEHRHFNRSSLPKALLKFAEGNFTFDKTTQWFGNLSEAPLYAGGQKQHIKDIIDPIADTITTAFLKIMDIHTAHAIDNELLRKITPLSLLKAIDQEVQKIKADQNILLISDFNEVISKSIANQPTPFIYERLGERYQHYFIDEFQDTSILQWQNLIPLIDNAVSTGHREEPHNSLMLVGDPKQAIYRWRGGYAEQFITLSAGQNPFQNQDKKTINLEVNWRSYDEIIRFNNNFFSTCATLFEEPAYREIYKEGNQQTINAQTGGQVSIHFVSAETVDEAEELYLEQTLKTITETLASGFLKKDICILTRKKKEGISLARYLQENGVDVISSESLLLAQSPQVCFIVNLLAYMRTPGAQSIRILLLEYLAKEQYNFDDVHAFYAKYLPLDGQKLFDALGGQSPAFSLAYCAQLPLYEGVEYIIRHFGLNKDGGAYLQFFLDAVFDFSEANESGVFGFLEWWAKNSETLSISTPPGLDAVQIMTIHKAKGLEFPVVVYPFAETALYPLKKTNWYHTDPLEYKGFKALLIGHKKQLLEFDEQSAQLYQDKRGQQQLDNLNVLYVVLTRPVQQLHIISRVTAKSGPKNDPSDFADLFVNYLHNQGLWQSGTYYYRFGESQKHPVKEHAVTQTEALILNSSSKESHNIVLVTRAEMLWDDTLQESINEGNLIHELLAGIKLPDDVPGILRQANLKGTLQKAESDKLEVKINLLLEKLKNIGFFKKQHLVYNERDLIYQGQVLRPDRVEIDATGNTLLLDYKTGSLMETHKTQIKKYALALEAMGHTVVKKILVYINNESPFIEV